MYIAFTSDLHLFILLDLRSSSHINFLQRMDVIRQKLAEAGVIGPIVDDFYRIYELEIIYGNKRISLADQVSPSELQHRPDHFEYSYDASYCEYLQRFGHPILIAVASLSLNPYISPLFFAIFFKSCPSVDTQGRGQ